MNRRLAAIASLLLFAASVVLAVVLGVQNFPRGLSVLACLVAALWAAWWALVHRGAARFAAATGAGVLLVGAVVLVVLEGRVLEDALIVAALALSVAAARRVFTVHATLLDVAPPKRAVLFYNPKSGGGSASAVSYGQPSARHDSAAFCHSPAISRARGSVSEPAGKSGSSPPRQRQ